MKKTRFFTFIFTQKGNPIFISLFASVSTLYPRHPSNMTSFFITTASLLSFFSSPPQSFYKQSDRYSFAFGGHTVQLTSVAHISGYTDAADSRFFSSIACHSDDNSRTVVLESDDANVVHGSESFLLSESCSVFLEIESSLMLNSSEQEQDPSDHLARCSLEAYQRIHRVLIFDGVSNSIHILCCYGSSDNSSKDR